ncbi:hypothetical protein PZT57_27010 [Pseudomonas aeruginosa]|uniref:hypothetical protein n=1 Tax=Pseudomonas aeruginosa TaxID=287 RepID=UPI002B266534|nr:hypothetical protein [Pseudomonas aeruginosa]MEA8592302.1 hypothetical protein [Pseudomonas aeruginosa]
MSLLLTTVSEQLDLTSSAWLVPPTFIKAEAPIFGEEGPLQADSDELELDSLAYDFWSYRDISGQIEPMLPARLEPRLTGQSV